MLSKVITSPNDSVVSPAFEEPAAEPVLWPRRQSWYDTCKAVVEFCVTLVLFVIATPIVLLSAVLVKLASRGPAFYTQTRLGLGGKQYTIYKLRSMYHDCERQSGPRWSTAGDSRITPLGYWLRRTHIDELPQLWNVIRGEMSLIGPRPERPEFIPHIEEAFPLYRLRREVRPGVTGLAQVQLPPDTDLESVRNKLAYDLYYVYHSNLWLDLQLLAGTVLCVCGVSYAHIRKLVFLPNGEMVERAYRQLTLEHARPCQADSAVINPTVPVVDVEMVTCA
jgi:lipopolysaccharide/colanic/teichoic acid biosynthesis glycosyltransferase